jgi:hypothetical protein
MIGILPEFFIPDCLVNMGREYVEGWVLRLLPPRK